jgi:hypothetical protein
MSEAEIAMWGLQQFFVASAIENCCEFVSIL